MEKTMNGCYDLCTVWTDSYGYVGRDGIYLKVENNKIVDCVEPLKGHSCIKYDLEYNLRTVIGENVKDFILDSVETSKIAGTDVSKIGYVTFGSIENEKYSRSKHEVFATEAELKEHDQKVADILQAKENINALGKTDMLSKIADMKGHADRK